MGPMVMNKHDADSVCISSSLRRLPKRTPSRPIVLFVSILPSPVAFRSTVSSSISPPHLPADNKFDDASQTTFTAAIDGGCFFGELKTEPIFFTSKFVKKILFEKLEKRLSTSDRREEPREGRDRRARGIGQYRRLHSHTASKSYWYTYSSRR